MPITIKDSYQTAGMRTTSGAPELAAFIPPEDAWPVARLREAGALHIDEAAIFQTIEKMRLIVDEAKTATKIARQQRERRLRLIQGGKRDSPPSDSSPRVEPSADEDDEYSKLPILPFEEWS